MAVKIRLTRTGRKNYPFYRIGAFDSRMQRDGAALEYLGYYDPREITRKRLEMNVERVKYWLSVGAEPSETVASFLRAEKVEYKKERTVRRRARTRDRMKGRAAARKARRRTAGGGGAKKA